MSKSHQLMEKKKKKSQKKMMKLTEIKARRMRKL